MTRPHYDFWGLVWDKEKNNARRGIAGCFFSLFLFTSSTSAPQVVHFIRFLQKLARTPAILAKVIYRHAYRFKREI
jgi:hypothetical protein